MGHYTNALFLFIALGAFLPWLRLRPASSNAKGSSQRCSQDGAAKVDRFEVKVV